MRGATGVTIQPHQILRLPGRKTRMLDPCHIWHVIYNARSNRCPPPTSPNTAPATKNGTAKFQRKCLKTIVKRHFQWGHDPSMFREWSEHETVSPQPASQPRLVFGLATTIFFLNTTFAPRLSFKKSPSAALATKSDTWTSPNTATATKSHTWTSPSTAPATKSDTWTSPSAAPATKSDNWTSPSTAPACHVKWLASLILLT